MKDVTEIVVCKKDDFNKCETFEDYLQGKKRNSTTRTIYVDSADADNTVQDLIAQGYVVVKQTREVKAA